MRVPDLVKYDYVALIQRKQTTVELKKKESDNFGLLPQSSAGKNMELGKRRQWQNFQELLLVCRERRNKAFTFSPSGFPKKMKFAQLCSLCLTPQEFLWPFSSMGDREEAPKMLHPLKFHEGCCVQESPTTPASD